MSGRNIRQLFFGLIIGKIDYGLLAKESIIHELQQLQNKALLTISEVRNKADQLHSINMRGRISSTMPTQQQRSNFMNNLTLKTGSIEYGDLQIVICCGNHTNFTERQPQMGNGRLQILLTAKKHKHIVMVHSNHSMGSVR